MPISVSVQQLQLLAPNARTSYRNALSQADTVLAVGKINENTLRLAHFMAQILHETGGLTIQIESMNYSAERMMVVWPKRFPTLADALPFAHNPRALANKTYGGRMGNRDPDDGFRYIGRGMMQITGRESYETMGSALNIPLAANPDLAFGPDWSLKIAAAEWSQKGCNALADKDDIEGVTRAINGGRIGIASRKEWLRRTKNVWK